MIVFLDLNPKSISNPKSEKNDGLKKKASREKKNQLDSTSNSKIGSGKRNRTKLSRQISIEKASFQLKTQFWHLDFFLGDKYPPDTYPTIPTAEVTTSKTLDLGFEEI